MAGPASPSSKRRSARSASHVAARSAPPEAPPAPASARRPPAAKRPAAGSPCAAADPPGGRCCPGRRWAASSRVGGLAAARLPAARMLVSGVCRSCVTPRRKSVWMAAIRLSSSAWLRTRAYRRAWSIAVRGLQAEQPEQIQLGRRRLGPALPDRQQDGAQLIAGGGNRPPRRLPTGRRRGARAPARALPSGDSARCSPSVQSRQRLRRGGRIVAVHAGSAAASSFALRRRRPAARWGHRSPVAPCPPRWPRPRRARALIGRRPTASARDAICRFRSSSAVARRRWTAVRLSAATSAIGAPRSASSTMDAQVGGDHARADDRHHRGPDCAPASTAMRSAVPKPTLRDPFGREVDERRQADQRRDRNRPEQEQQPQRRPAESPWAQALEARR